MAVVIEPTLCVLSMVNVRNPNSGQLFERAWYRIKPNKLLRFETERLKTFAGQRLIECLSPNDFAEVGMFLDCSDMRRTICHFCMHGFYDWKAGDNPYLVHLMANPSCPLLTDPTNAGNVPIAGGLTDWERELYLPIPVRVKNLTHVQKNNRRNRRMLNNKFTPHLIQRMIESGFIPTGVSDIVSCPHCHLRLNRWPHDLSYSPSIAHAFLSESCEFIRRTFTVLQISKLRLIAQRMLHTMHRNRKPFECVSCRNTRLHRAYYPRCGHVVCTACDLNAIQCPVCHRKIFVRVRRSNYDPVRPYEHIGMLSG